jgi:preprotein translocase subunit SecA
MAQKDPLVEYRHEGHLMFQELGLAIREEVVSAIFHAQVTPQDAQALEVSDGWDEEDAGALAYQHQSLAGAEAIAAAGGSAVAAPATAVAAGAIGGATTVATQQRIATEFEKVGRNDPCPCGSGKKFKKCHGA